MIYITPNSLVPPLLPIICCEGVAEAKDRWLDVAVEEEFGRLLSKRCYSSGRKGQATFSFQEDCGGDQVDLWVFGSPKWTDPLPVEEKHPAELLGQLERIAESSRSAVLYLQTAFRCN